MERCPSHLYFGVGRADDESLAGRELCHIGAHRADYYGNLDYALTARNFNPMMAMAGATVIAEPAEIVPVGVIPPDEVVTPAAVVDHLVEQGEVHGR